MEISPSWLVCQIMRDIFDIYGEQGQPELALRMANKQKCMTIQGIDVMFDYRNRKMDYNLKEREESQKHPSNSSLITLNASYHLELAIPRKGHVLSQVAEFYGKSIRKAVFELTKSLARNSQSRKIYQLLFPFYESEQPFHCQTRKPSELAAWAIISMWVSGVATRELSIDATLREAEIWFFGKKDCPFVSMFFNTCTIEKAQRSLRETVDPSAYQQLLPYILDPHGPGSRLSVKRYPNTYTSRVRKRAEGVFYTPADIAHYMVSTCLDSIDNSRPIPILDPACGTGVFLRAALSELRRRHVSQKVSQLATDCLFGVDIDPWPLNAATFVLITDIRSAGETDLYTPAELWNLLRPNFACIDALNLDPMSEKNDTSERMLTHSPKKICKKRVSISRLFPRLKNGPRMIVGNPPYAKLGKRINLSELSSKFRTLVVKASPTAEIYLAFLEQMIRLANDDHFAGAFVLPLSIASNVGPQFATARTLIENTPGTWRFAFFDREPHALFGEDVKTRNAIVLWSKKPSDEAASLATGPLRKWRGASRATMFNNLRFTPIENNIQAGIPKIDGVYQATALNVLSTHKTHLENAVIEIKRATLDQTPYSTDKTVFVGPTAYNFLNVFLKPQPELLSVGQALSEHPLHAIICASNEDALAVYAMLSSHLAYWWWHAHGDGFHVSKRMITTFPFGVETLTGLHVKNLAKYGAALWAAISPNPILSLNRGKTSLAYSPNSQDKLRRRIDEILSKTANLSHFFIDELQQFTTHTVAASLRTEESATLEA